MARKVCPSCKKLNAGSAAACSSCGQAFNAASIVKRTKPKQCPLCGTGNPQSAHTCHCGYHFDENPDEIRERLRDRSHAGTAMMIFGIVGVAGFLVMRVYANLISWGVMVASVSLGAKGLHVRAVARGHLRELDKSALPAAKIVDGS